MKTLLMILFLAIGAQAQVWGEQRLIFGNTFRNTDSLELTVAGMTDTVHIDTLYTKAIEINKSSGLYGVAMQIDTLQGASATIALDVRLIEVFSPQPQQRDFLGTYTPRGKVVSYGAWQDLISATDFTLNTLSIAQSDSSWWKPNYNYLQYRLREADADTSLHNVNEFRDLEDTIK